MLTNDYGEKLSKRLKQTFFNTQMSLMSNRLEVPFALHYVFALFYFWFNMSVFFIDNPLSPQIFNDIFKAALVSSISQMVGTSINVFKILNIVLDIIALTLYTIHLRSNFMNNAFTKFLNVQIHGFSLIVIIQLHMSLSGIKEETAQTFLEQRIINLVSIFLSVMCCIIFGGFIYFKVRPFRKRSVFWSVNNHNQFYSYVLNIIRVLIITLDGRSVSFLIISFVLEIFLRKSVHQQLTKESKKLQSFSSNLSLSVHLALLVNDFTGSSDLAAQILAFLLLISLISGALSCYSIINEQRYFPLCNSPIWEYYDFYFHFLQKKIKGNNKSKLSIKKDSDSDKILSVHALNCSDKNCKIKNVKFSEDTYCEDLENLSSEALVNRSNQTEQNELIHELWKFETGNKYKFRMQSKNIPILYEYIIYCALNLSRLNEKSDSVNQENIKSLKNIFYDKLQNCLECFSLFYEEITKTQPKMDTILYVGCDIKKRALDLKTMYSELLKHSVINFKTAEVYVEFQNYFLKENNVNEESIDRLRKIQKSKQADHIEEIYLPTLTSYSQSGLIQNMNTECLSFFRLTRFQMKSKCLGSLIYPEIGSSTEIKERIKSNKNQRLCTFFKRRDEIVFGYLTIKEKYIENKKFDVVTIEKNAYSDYKNVLLIKKDSFQIKAVEKEETYIRPNLNFSNHLTLRWRYLYDTYLQQKIEQLAHEKIVKVRIDELENSLFVINVEQNLHEDYYVVNIKVIKDIEKKKNRVSSFMINKAQPSVPKTAGKFNFFYDFEDYQSGLTLYGVNNSYFRYNTTLKKTKSLGKLQKNLSNLIVANTLLQDTRYTKGIKTYRLWEKQLYNIDLQDKDKYVEMFEDKISNANEHAEQKSNETDLYIMTGIFSILIILVGLSIGYNALATSVHEDVAAYYTNGFKIEQLRLEMNRICAITRDIEDKRYVNNTVVSWKRDLLTSYASLKSLRFQSLLFESDQITVAYRNINYTGTLNEIIDVMISHIYEMTLGNASSTQINYFHDTYIGNVNPRIVAQKDKINQKLAFISVDFKKIQEILLIVGIIVIFVFYVLLGLLIVVLNNSAKKKMINLMMMSDNEARMNQTMAEKLKYAVDMIKKNFDFDLKAIVGPAQHHRQRKKSKEVIVGIQKKILIVLSLLVGFGVHCFIYFNFTSEITNVLQKVNEFQYQGGSLMQTYSVFTELTNKMNHFNNYDKEAVDILRQKVNFLNFNRLNFKFDQQTNAFIDNIFYENSCDDLNGASIFSDEPVECYDSLPEYIVKNPFELGITAYFSKAQYNVFDNITQTYGCTGVYSGPFVRTFSLIADKILTYGLSYIKDSFKKLDLYNFIYGIISAAYLIITLAVIYFLKGMNKEIIDLLSFLSFNDKNLTKKIKKAEIQNDQYKIKKDEKLSPSLSEGKLNSQNSDNSISQDSDKRDRK